MRKNEDFPVNEGVCRGKRFKARCSKSLEPLLKEMTEIEHGVIKLLISMSGQLSLVNEELFDGQEYLKNYCAENMIKFDQELVDASKHFYNEFSKTSQSKGFATFIFSMKEINSEFVQSTEIRHEKHLEKVEILKANFDEKKKNGKIKEDKEFKEPDFNPSLKILRDRGLFPFKNALTSQQCYSLCKSIHSVLSSYRKLSDERKQELDLWRNRITCHDRFEDYQKVGNFFKDLEESGEFKMSTKTFRKFLRNWQNPNGDREKSLGELFLEKLESDPKTKFRKEDQYLYGYSEIFLNCLFFNHQNLWRIFLEKISSGDSKNPSFLQIIINNYHFKKDLINISTRKANGKFVSLCLGYNQLLYTMSYDGNIKFKVKSLGLEVSTVGHMFTFLEVLESDDKKGIYKIKFTQDSRREHVFIGYVKEPRISFMDGEYFVDFPISSIILEGNIDLDYSTLKNNQLYFKSSCQKNRYFEGDGVHPFVSFDLGLNPLFVGVSGSFEKYGDSFKFSFDGEKIVPFNNKTDMVSFYHKEIKFNRCISQLLKVTVQHKNNKRVYWSFKNGSAYVDCSSILNVSKEEFLSELDSLPDLSPDYLFAPLFKAGWSLMDYIKQSSQVISKIRSGYRNSENKKDHTTKDNFVDYSLVCKIELIASFISLQTSLSYNEKGCCKKLKKYLVNLREKMTKDVAAILVSIAIEKKVRYIFIEDLDAKTSSLDTRDKNSLKRFMRSAELRKWIANRAEKFGIVVIAVDPDLTSITDYETRFIGHRDRIKKQNLYVERNGDVCTIDSDFNAAKNIAYRAFKRHSDINHFIVDEIYGGLRLDGSDLGARRQDSLKNAFGTSSLLIERIDGKLIARKLSNSEKKMPKLNEKSLYAYFVEDNWYVRHESNEKVHGMAKKAGLIYYDLD